MLSPEDALHVRPGRTEMRLNLRPVNLQAGRYTVSLAAFDETKKQTILHSMHFSEVTVEGPVGGGPPYLLPMTVTLGDQKAGHAAAPNPGGAARMSQPPMPRRELSVLARK